jgi:hypothetical protein
MAVRNSTARQSDNTVSFTAWSYRVTLFKDAFVPKSKLYALKRAVLKGGMEPGHVSLDLKTYSAFTLKENGDIEPTFKRSLFTPTPEATFPPKVGTKQS